MDGLEKITGKREGIKDERERIRIKMGGKKKVMQMKGVAGMMSLGRRMRVPGTTHTLTGAGRRRRTRPGGCLRRPGLHLQCSRNTSLICSTGLASRGS